MHVLYRFLNEDDELLYVGITTDPPARFRGHRHSKSWWSEIATITLEHHDSAESLASAERSAIAAQRPRYNITHNAAGVLPVSPIYFPGEMVAVRCPYCCGEHLHHYAIARTVNRMRAPCGNGWYRLMEEMIDAHRS